MGRKHSRTLKQFNASVVPFPLPPIGADGVTGSFLMMMGFV